MTTDAKERPGLGADFFKAHGLGNDYLVFEAGNAWTARRAAVKAVCHRTRGVGSDGVVCGLGSEEGRHRLRMFNPDGSEFERSGNGLRIFAAFLASRGRAAEGEPFRVEVGGDEVEMEIVTREADGTHDVRVDMGRAEVGPEAVGMDAEYRTDGGTLHHSGLGALDVTLVSVGNPHCVYFAKRPGVETLRDVGPFLSAHRAFPRGVNVQVGRVVGPGRLRVRIWERGVGETSASGTSACAAAVAALHRGLIDAGRVEVEMDGGVLEVEVSDQLDVRLRGPVQEVCVGRLSEGFCRELEKGS